MRKIELIPCMFYTSMYFVVTYRYISKCVSGGLAGHEAPFA